MRSMMLSLCWVVALLVPSLAHAQADDAYQVIYVNAAGEVVALNPLDESQTTLLAFDNPLGRAFGFHVSPDGAHLAIFVRSLQGEQTAYSLYVLRLADGMTLLEQDLLPPDFSASVETGPGDPLYELTRALGAVEWSPDGRYVAFIGAGGETDPSADVYVYEPATQAMSATYELPRTAVELHWSPDSERLLFNEIASFGQAGEGYALDGYYLADLVADDLVRIESMSTPEVTGPLFIVGWADAQTLYWSPLDFESFGASGLYRYELTQDGPRVEEQLPPRIRTNVPVLDRATDAIAFTVPEVLANNLVPGAYLWLPGEDLPTFLQSGTFTWAEPVRAGQFQFETPETSYLVDVATQELRALPPHDFGAFVSPVSGVDLVALARQDGLYVSRISTDDAELVWSGETQVPIWSPDGTRFYSFGFVADQGGLIEIDLTTRTVRLLDDTMAVNSPRAVAR